MSLAGFNCGHRRQHRKSPDRARQPGLEARRKKITRPSGSHILTDTDNKKSPDAVDGASLERSNAVWNYSQPAVDRPSGGRQLTLYLKVAIGRAPESLVDG